MMYQTHAVPHSFTLLFADDTKLLKSIQTYNNSLPWIYKKILTQWLTGVGNGSSALMEANDVQWLVFHHYQNVILVPLIHNQGHFNGPVFLKKRLYITLVRSHLTYCSQLWRPRLIKEHSISGTDTTQSYQIHTSQFFLWLQN